MSTEGENIQIFMIIILLLSVIRIIMKLPNKLRIIVIVTILSLLAFNWYMVVYQEDLVNSIRDFFNLKPIS